MHLSQDYSLFWIQAAMQTWAIYIAIYRHITIIDLFSHILVYMLHWSCAFHQKLYCWYIGVVCHSPKIVLLLHWSCAIHQKLYCCLHWSCVIHQKLYCCYFGVVPFTKNCIVDILELCHSPKNCIVITLELHHSPKIVLLLHWSCDINQKLYCCYIGVVSFTKNCAILPKNYRKTLILLENC